MTTAIEAFDLRNAHVWDRIRWMRTHGSSLSMTWGEDNELWEVAWITLGVRHCGFHRQLHDALEQALRSAGAL